tara:strand:- start:3055 stop:3393 length:339 start_codon:yes stop_codon:yes gene_type:complete
MLKFKILISIFIFSFFLILTSIIKNQTREIEKKIAKLSSKIHYKEKDLNESQLDFFYLTSPSMIEQKISHLDKNQYFPMKHSKIFLSFSDFLNLQNKYAIQEENIEKKIKKK